MDDGNNPGDLNLTANIFKGEFNAAVYDPIYDHSSGRHDLKVLADTTLKGATYSASNPTFVDGMHKLISAIIDVTFQISRMPYCIPEGVTLKSTGADNDGVVNSQDNFRMILNRD